MARIYGKGEKPAAVFDLNNGTNKYNRYFFLRIGSVVEIDYEKYQYKVEWMTGGGSPGWINMSFPYVGPSGCIGTTPEMGALGIFGYLNTGNGAVGGTPLCLGWLPVNLQTALDHSSVKVLPDMLPTEEENVKFLKFRKLSAGDTIFASPLGAELFANHDIELKDSMHDNIQIRSGDQSIIMTSLNNFQYSDGVAQLAGQVIRNKIPLFDADGNRIQNLLAREVTTPDGRNSIYLVPYGQKIDEHSQFYSEYHIDVSEIVDGVLDTNDINNQSALVSRDPIVTMAMGNYVGSIASTTQYGKMLRPVLFSSINDHHGNFNLVECIQTNGMNQVDKLGMAYAVHLLKNDAFMGFDKEGHFYLNIKSSSSANPLGAGRSMSILALGNLKEVWGSDGFLGNSWDLSANGGIKWNIGAHTANNKSRSIDITASSSIYLEARNNDDDGYARQENIFGNQNSNIGGSDTKEVTGNSTLIVNGLRTEVYRGGLSQQHQADHSVNVLGVYTQVAIKEMQGKFGKQTKTILNGKDTVIVTGDSQETITTFGSKKVNVVLGNIMHNIVAGNKITNIVTGNHVTTVTTGNISQAALAGMVSVSASLGIFMSSPVTAQIKATTVSLGAVPGGGVLTGMAGGVANYYESLTGLPGIGSMTVQASN